MSLPRAQLQSLTAELKFHKLRGKKQKKQKTIVTEVKLNGLKTKTQLKGGFI